jgi:molybdenum cofactor synthesis domain-containing protein
MPTAAVIIIGNEILTGKFADENAPFLIRRLRELGCDLLRIVTIPDTEEGIASEVRSASAAHDWVFTTGGVGPTHDDLTFPSIAKAFGVGLARHSALAEILRSKLGTRCNEAALRMADVPEGAELWWDGDFPFPQVVVRNVVVFPGVPSLLRRKFEAICHRFAGVPVVTARIVTLRTEPEIADDLTEAAARWPSIAIGSYPRWDERPPTVIVTMEGRNDEALAACEAFLRERVPAMAGDGGA